jgi:hypothetical protein
VLLDISLLFFKLAANPAKYIDSPTYQFVSNASSPTVRVMQIVLSSVSRYQHTWRPPCSGLGNVAVRSLAYAHVLYVQDTGS